MPRYAATDTPLAGNGTVTLNLQSGREDYVVGMVFADQTGTLFIEESMDNTNWDVSTSIPVVANTGQSFKQDIFGPFVRVRYVNDATPQTKFRLTARLSSAGNK